jgi:hypothetical protein
VRAVHRAADHQGDGARVRQQPRPQLQREGLYAAPPRLAAIGEHVVVDLAEQTLDQRLDHGGLVRKVGVHRVRGHPDLRGNTPHGRRGRPALVEQTQRGVEDLVLSQGATRATTAALGRCRHRFGHLP